MSDIDDVTHSHDRDDAGAQPGTDSNNLLGTRGACRCEAPLSGPTPLSASTPDAETCHLTLPAECPADGVLNNMVCPNDGCDFRMADERETCADGGGLYRLVSPTDVFACSAVCERAAANDLLFMVDCPID